MQEIKFYTAGSLNQRLNSREAAKHCGLGFSTMAKLRLSGGGPRYMKIGSKIIYDSADLDRWLASKRAENTSQYSGGMNAGE
jgi:hypothetical protein